MRQFLAFPFAALAMVFLLFYGICYAVAETIAGDDNDNDGPRGGCAA